MTIQRYDSIPRFDDLAGSTFEPAVDGHWVTFEDHERELARYKGGVEDWASKWQSTQAELEAHKAMSKLVIDQLGASMTAAAERMKRLVEDNATLTADNIRMQGEVGAAQTALFELREAAQALVDACNGRGDGRPYPPLKALEALLGGKP